jgi:hypothetical protein
MRIHKLAAFALAPFVLLACEPQTDGDPMLEDDGVAEERAHQIGDTETLNLGEVDDSGVTGDVRFTVLTMNETDVVIEVDDAQPNASYQVAIHQGTCDTVGQQRYPLESIQTNAEGDGATSTTLNIRLADVMDGNHVVALYGPRSVADGDADTADDTDLDPTDDDMDVRATGDRPVACGEIGEFGGLGW